MPFQKGNKYAGNRRGEKFTEEHKKKIGLANKGKTNFFKGKKRPQETREKMRKNNSHWNKGKSLSEEHKKKISEAHKGEKNHNWKGGNTPWYIRVRQSPEMRLWRKAIFERDNYKCVWCGNSGYLEADHIKPFALFPELRFAIDNGRTLCRDCHKKTSTYAGKNNKK